jgi:tellurite methyltransferase
VTNPNDLHHLFGNIDIYLFDQLLKGRLTPDMTILDAGCGDGRNLVYLMRRGCRAFGIDETADAIEEIRLLATRIAPDLPVENFQVGKIDALPFPDENFDAVLCNAVLHFAADERHFNRMLRELWRVLKPDGVFFSRLASSIGIAARIEHIDGRRYRLQDGTDRFLVDEEMLLSLANQLGGELVDPIKTTNVQGKRCMTTWVLKKTVGSRPLRRSVLPP